MVLEGKLEELEDPFSLITSTRIYVPPGCQYQAALMDRYGLIVEHYRSNQDAWEEMSKGLQPQMLARASAAHPRHLQGRTLCLKSH